MRKLDEGFTYRVEEGKLYRPGVKKTAEGICFTAVVPDKQRCSLLLYKKGEEEVAAAIPMGSSVRYGDIRSLLVERLPIEEYEYNFLIGGNVVTDLYAQQICGREVWGVPIAGDGKVRGKAVLEEYDWEGDKPLQIPYEEVITYATHVRGFTKDSSSRVKAKGTFTGIMEKIPYLTELGINQLELMPVYEFEEVRGTKASDGNPIVMSRGAGMNYWGYQSAFYFAPKASYSATGNPVREVKDLVKGLHKAGIELILEFYFPKGTKASLIQECIRYWVLEYHIDGVHVNSSGTPVEVLAQDPLLSHTKIMTEGFDLDWVYEEGYVPTYRNLAIYNDDFMVPARRLLKGDEGQVGPFTRAARRNPAKCAVVNYLASHNGFTLKDAVSYEEKHNEANGEGNNDGTNYNYSWNCGAEGVTRRKEVVRLRMQQLRNAFVMLLLSQGTPLLYGGDECGNSQSGNNNVYCQDNELSWVNWKPAKAEEFLTDYVKALIAFRKANPVFHQKKELTQTDYLSCGCPDVSYHGKNSWFGDFEDYSRGIGILYAGDYVPSAVEDRGSSFYVIYNMHGSEREFALPTLPKGQEWKIAIDTGKEGCTGLYPEGQELKLEGKKTHMVPARTILVLIGK